MPIKLEPEHVGGRVLLSDGDVAWICRFHDEHVSVTGGLWIEFFDLNGAHSAEGSEYRVTLLLDAPNPLDVEVPEWCRWVIGWRVFDAAPPHLIPAIHGAADFQHDVFGWSPAPGQMPPRETADNGE